MGGFFKNKPVLILTLIALVLVIIILVTATGHEMTWLESTVGVVVQPVQTFASKVSGKIIDFVQNMFNTTDADKENAQLRVRVAQLEQAEQELEELKQENDRLRNLLNFTTAAPENQYVSASVIGSESSVWFNVFTINAGRNHGISEDMPVVCADGLVGRVTDVGATWSKITSIIDSTSTASVMVERTRDNGMVRGMVDSVNEDRLELYYLPAGADLLPGDVIVTSELGGVFPKGIEVGTVIEVTRQTGESSVERNAIVQTAVDFSHLEEVMVIVSTEATAESVQEAGQ